ncbi:hypothetical protein EVAR_61892_1 [Eumeta japonica]|uniref:Uncharacterized protein n=1 Tax=Eumeta variegata TaxID=151549 RepID=A0A4C1YV36_EUMVA|nr:hypothetical protein EVAR_61892_1 [Eumeta japonica]
MTVSAHSVDGSAWPETQPPVQPRPQPHRQEPKEVTEIYLEGEIPQQARVLVADFDGTADKNKDRHSPLVVSGKMTLSLIQDSPRDTPEREPESTADDFTTASAVTQPAAEKKEVSDDEMEEEVVLEESEEEVEVEEIEEEEGEEEEEEEPKPQIKEIPKTK